MKKSNMSRLALQDDHILTFSAVFPLRFDKKNYNKIPDNEWKIENEPDVPVRDTVAATASTVTKRYCILVLIGKTKK